VSLYICGVAFTSLVFALLTRDTTPRPVAPAADAAPARWARARGHDGRGSREGVRAAG
jgi:hypothetical protein